MCRAKKSEGSSPSHNCARPSHAAVAEDVEEDDSEKHEEDLDDDGEIPHVGLTITISGPLPEALARATTLAYELRAIRLQQALNNRAHGHRAHNLMHSSIAL